MRVFACILVLLPMATFPASPWPHASYVQVRAYAYNREGDIGRPIMKNGHLDASVINKRGIILTPQQSTRLISAVADKHPIPHSMMACFNPRHAFVFYDAAKKPVATVELCFECHNAHAEPQHDQVCDVAALEQLARELKLPLVPK